MKKSIVLPLILLLIIYSCSKKTASTATTKPAPQAVDTVASASIDIAVAENQFRQTCGSCHALPDPKKHTAAEWPNTVNKMQQKKNGFDDTRKEQILVFLAANARQ